MKIKVLLELDNLDRKILKGVIGKKDVDYEDYRRVIRELLKDKIQEIDMSKDPTIFRSKTWTVLTVNKKLLLTDCRPSDFARWNSKIFSGYQIELTTLSINDDLETLEFDFTSSLN